MHPTCVINVVGLTSALLGEDTPNLNALRAEGSCAPVRAAVPAVTCTAQATYLTGTLPRDHGIVGNGWYFRDLAQVLFWRQNNGLIQGEKVWDSARRRDAAFTCANMFWWFNMYSSVDWSVTPRPIYPADGRKIPDIYSSPADLRDRLTSEIGAFPFFQFWGPNAGAPSSEWIALASIAVDRWFSPTLLLVYLPHLDYDLQRAGASDPRTRENVRTVDRICGQLLAHCRDRGRRVIVLSEYGLTDVARPVHINRVLRQEGWLAVRDELGTDAFDPGASLAFAVSDHQVAHVYVQDPRRIPDVKARLQQVPGVDVVLDRVEQTAWGLDHERSGELVAVSAPDAWFTYYYWLNDDRAPDYARTVDIHRKPGYDPVELFLDPALRMPKLRIAATLVRGSHGRPAASLDDGPVFMSSEKDAVAGPIDATAVRDQILAHLFQPQR
jgi:predicted AlkP superfamily pyrophosphatase or phosphodiesterase